MNKAQRNKNPGNLRYAGQKEATGAEGGFAIFPDDPAGWRALVRQIRLDQDRGDTIETFIKGYAPANENDTDGYIKFVADGLKCDRGEFLASFSPYAVAGLVAQREGYFVK